MSQTLLLRDRSVQLTDTERAGAAKALEQAVRGVDEKNHKRWLRFLRNLFSLEHGEVAEIGTRLPRSGPFHRFHMAIEQAVFDAQERFASFGQFRSWIYIGTGFCDWVPGAKGGIVPIPKSISYAELDESAMREFHTEMCAFLRGPHAPAFLWKQMSPQQAADMMDTILRGFDQ